MLSILTVSASPILSWPTLSDFLLLLPRKPVASSCWILVSVLSLYLLRFISSIWHDHSLLLETLCPLGFRTLHSLKFFPALAISQSLGLSPCVSFPAMLTPNWPHPVARLKILSVYSECSQVASPVWTWPLSFWLPTWHRCLLVSETS